MRGDLTLFILESIQSVIGVTLETLTEMADSRLNYHRRSMPSTRFRYKAKPIFKSTIDKLEERRKFKKLFYKLRAEGLMAPQNNGELQITERGAKRLQDIRERRNRLEKYTVKDSDTLKIVAFDIPEGQSAKRNWLRSVLKNLNFFMLQKSVWVGKTQLPEAFFEDLRNKNIFKYIQVVGITKRGTLKEIGAQSSI